LEITMCIIPWADSGASHENALSMRCGVSPSFDQQIFRSARIAQMRPGKRRVRAGIRHAAFGLAGDRPRIGRLEAESAGQSTRAEQDLQQMQRAAVWNPLEWAEIPRMA
jgi:hypothetical protein